MADTVNVQEARTHFSKLLERVRRGEEIIIAKAGKPVARLSHVSFPGALRTPGSARGQVVIADEFDAPLPDKEFAGSER